jgi:hypothetical protein
MKLTVDIDVLNPEEVVKVHKGQIMSLLSDVMLSKDKLKQRVEKAILDELVKQLSVELPKALKDEAINASINYKITEEDSDY